MKTIQFPPGEDISNLPNDCIVKFGIDPTADKLHLGHLIPLLLCKKLQSEGKQIKIILGTFTAQIGDPTGKEKTRPIISKEETVKNAEHIIVFIKKFFNEKAEILFNHHWLEKHNSNELFALLGKFTWAQLSARDNFQKRLENNESISMSELIMPLLQGLDSVEVNADIEVGGVDQLFNFKITREVQQLFSQKPEICLMTNIITGTDGRKMSKSLNNCIFLNDSPNDVFGKTMSIPDNLMNEWFDILGLIKPSAEQKFSQIEKKKLLAHGITSIIHGIDEAEKSLKHFTNVIQDKNTPSPDNIKRIDSSNLIDCIMKIRNTSKREANQLIKSNAVRINGVITNSDLNLQKDTLIQIGKRQFVKII